MTVLTAINKVVVAGNGAQTVFSFPFVGVAAADIQVFYTSAAGVITQLVQGATSGQFQVSLNAPVPPALWGIGGTVTYSPGAAIPSGSSLTILRVLPFEQLTGLQNQASYGQLASATEMALDQLAMQIQQVEEVQGRSIAVALSDPAPAVLPTAALRAGQVLAFDQHGDPIAIAPSTVSIAGLPIVMPQSYGALGNGAHDDTAAIQAALNAGAVTGSIVYFPATSVGYLLANGQSISVPDNSFVLCSPGATFLRNTDPAGGFGLYTAAMIQIGSNVIWRGGTVKNTTVMGTSATSHAIGTGSLTFTTQAGLPYTAGTVVWIDDQANPANWLEGAVTAYSGTTLTVNVAAKGGTGTKAAWNISTGALYQAAIVLHGSTQSLVEDVDVVGRWYVGILMDGWNPPAGGPLLVSDCAVRSCYAASTQNRPFYMYGSVIDSDWDDCHVIGNGVTNYGFNYNPANATGSANAIQRCGTMNCTVVNATFQGYEWAEACFDNIASGCRAYNISDASGIGFLIQVANAGANPADNQLVNCIAEACGAYGFLFYAALYCSATGCEAKSCLGTGIYVEGDASNPALYSQYCLFSGCITRNNTNQGVEVGLNCVSTSLEGLMSIGNGGTGVLVDAGATYTRCSGRSAANSTNLTDNGTNTVNLLTTH